MRSAISRASSRPWAVPQAGARRSSLLSSSPKRWRSSARSMASALVPSSFTPAFMQRHRQAQRRLPAELDDHALGLLGVDDLQHVLARERLEVQPVGGVVVGRHRLRVAVDHDGLVAVLAQRLHGVDAAVVELDPLADAVGAAAQDRRSSSCSVGRRLVSRPSPGLPPIVLLVADSRRSSRGTASAPRTRRRRCRPA